MSPTTSKSVLAYVIVSATLLAAGRSSAQVGPALAASDFAMYFERYEGNQWVQMSALDQQYFFNRARCQCGHDSSAEFKIVIQPAVGTGQKIQALLAASQTGGQGVGRLFAGTPGYDCLAPNSLVGGVSLQAFCTNLLDPGNYPGLSFGMTVFENVNFWESPPIPVSYLFNSISFPTSCGFQGTCDSTSLCSSTIAQTTIQFWAQTNSGIAPDLDPGPAASVSLVGMVPVVPSNVTAQGGNEALTVSWGWPANVNPVTEPSYLGVQLLCQRGTDNQVFKQGSFSPAYMTAATLCPATATAPAPGSPFSDFDPKYLCSGLIPPTTTSYRITGLQNGIPYAVGVAAVDRFGNIGALSDVIYGTPNVGTGPSAAFTNGCSFAVRGKHDRSKTAGSLWLAVMALAFARRKRATAKSP
jgi:hypothetical protein